MHTQLICASFHRHLLRSLLLIAILAAPKASWAIVSSNADPGGGIFNGVNVNRLVGAETFYANGYWGSSAVISNVEAGFVWSGHDTLGKVSTYICDPSIDQSTMQYDFHATMVGQVLAGSLPTLNVDYGDFTLTYTAPYTYYVSGTLSNGNGFNGSALTGLAPSAELWSAAIATNWNFAADHSEELVGSFSVSAESLTYAYATSMFTGVNGKTADVINSSWGNSAVNDGTSSFSKIIDALTYSTHKTVVIAVGNDSGVTSDPAAGFNCISVAALSSDTSTPVYGSVASFSNHGPIAFYNPQTGQTVANARVGVDIAAPGDNLTLALYAGMTGGHDPSYPGTSDPTNGSGSYFFSNVGGTSFASPIVAGGAALVVDAGKKLFASNSHAIDGRIVKAVLLNSATKTAGWDNGQTLVGGVIKTTQSLDYSVGAGVLNLDTAYTQYTKGTADVAGLAGGSVSKIGWDFGGVAHGGANDYFIADTLSPGKFTATLIWFVDRELDSTGLDGTDVKFDNLDLQLWKVVDSQTNTLELVAESASLYNTVEHMYIDILESGSYMLRVLNSGAIFDLSAGTSASTEYGLAWLAVPEPGTWAIFFVTGAGYAIYSRIRGRKR